MEFLTADVSGLQQLMRNAVEVRTVRIEIDPDPVGGAVVHGGKKISQSGEFLE